MSLGRFDKRRHRRPSQDDAARKALVVVVEAREYVRADGAVCRGPIDRKRGHVPTRRWSNLAGAYIEEHHYAYCVDFARSRAARHIPLDDMIQACRLGCFTALERFDLEHPETHRFLSYAKWWLYYETQHLIFRDEQLVLVDDRLREARDRLLKACPPSMSDEEAAEATGMTLAEVRLCRGCHLGHDHRAVDERSRAVRHALRERRAHDEALREDAARLEAAGLEAAVALLPSAQRRLVCEEYGLRLSPGEMNGAASAPLPATPDRRRALLALALRSLRAGVAQGGEE